MNIASFILPSARVFLIALLLQAAACVSSNPTPGGSGNPATFDPLEGVEVIRLDNGEAYVEIAPALGRVVGYGRVGSPSRIWMDSNLEVSSPKGYINAGGDKVWPTVQALWPRVYGQKGRWPPDPWIDGQPWQVVDRGERWVTMQSRVSPPLQVRVRRTVELASAGSRVEIDNVIKRVGESPYPVMVWTVSQVPVPEMTLLGSHPEVPTGWPKAVYFGNASKIEPLLGASTPQALVWPMRIGDRPTLKGHGKLGTFGDWLAGVDGETVWLQYGSYDPSGPYPDGSNVQVYTSPRYSELELLSPSVQLQPGETLAMRVVWELIDRGGRNAAALSRDLAERVRSEP